MVIRDKMHCLAINLLFYLWVLVRASQIMSAFLFLWLLFGILFVAFLDKIGFLVIMMGALYADSFRFILYSLTIMILATCLEAVLEPLVEKMRKSTIFDKEAEIFS